MDLFDMYARSSDFFAGISAFLLIIPAIFGLLNCFFGYRLFKVWMALCGFLAGGIVAAVVVSHFTDETWIRAAAILGVAVVCALISYQVYLIGAFFIGWAMTFFSVYHLINSLGAAGRRAQELLLFSILIGLVVAILIVKFSKPTIILFTGISGAMSAGGSIAQLVNVTDTALVFAIGAVLAAAGILVQIWMNHGLFHRK